MSNKPALPPLKHLIHKKQEQQQHYQPQSAGGPRIESPNMQSSMLYPPSIQPSRQPSASSFSSHTPPPPPPPQLPTAYQQPWPAGPPLSSQHYQQQHSYQALDPTTPSSAILAKFGNSSLSSSTSSLASLVQSQLNHPSPQGNIADLEIQVPFFYTRAVLQAHLEAQGVLPHQEIETRRRHCDYIRKICRRLGFPYSTTSAALQMFHRYYARNSLDFSIEDVMCTCILVACKVQETVKKARDIIITARSLVHGEEIDAENPEIEETKRRMFSIERHLLETLCFDFAQIQFAHTYVIKFVKLLNGTMELARSAWTLADDSYTTTLSVQYPAHTIAVAAIYLACRVAEYESFINSIPLAEAPVFPRMIDISWVAKFKCMPANIQDVCLQIIESYQQDSQLSNDQVLKWVRLAEDVKNSYAPPPPPPAPAPVVRSSAPSPPRTAQPPPPSLKSISKGRDISSSSPSYPYTNETANNDSSRSRRDSLDDSRDRNIFAVSARERDEGGRRAVLAPPAGSSSFRETTSSRLVVTEREDRDRRRTYDDDRDLDRRGSGNVAGRSSSTSVSGQRLPPPPPLPTATTAAASREYDRYAPGNNSKGTTHKYDKVSVQERGGGHDRDYSDPPPRRAVDRDRDYDRDRDRDYDNRDKDRGNERDRDREGDYGRDRDRGGRDRDYDRDRNDRKGGGGGRDRDSRDTKDSGRSGSGGLGGGDRDRSDRGPSLMTIKRGTGTGAGIGFDRRDRDDHSSHQHQSQYQPQQKQGPPSSSSSKRPLVVERNRSGPSKSSRRDDRSRSPDSCSDVSSSFSSSRSRSRSRSRSTDSTPPARKRSRYVSTSNTKKSDTTRRARSPADAAGGGGGSGGGGSGSWKRRRRSFSEDESGRGGEGSESDDSRYNNRGGRSGISAPAAGVRGGGGGGGGRRW